MPRLSMTDVAQHAANAGFSGRDLTIAVAVAYAESSGRTDAIGDGGNSIGLWQIHMPSHPQYSKAALLDPATNAKAAKAIQSSGRGWANWTQYRNGIYALYMAGAATAAQRVKPRGGILGLPAEAASHLPDTSAGVGGLSLGPIIDALQKTGTWISNPRNWIRIMYVMVGGALIVGALVVVAAPAAAPVVKTAIRMAR